MKSTICLFAKAPQAGRAKTRLIPALGLAGSGAVAKALLLDALASWKNSEVLVAHAGDWETWPELLAGRDCIEQGQGDLGQRMERVLQFALGRGEVAIAVGTDIPGLGDTDGERAASALLTHDAVIGPSSDGGFYLLALRSCPTGLLAGIRWSAPTTRAETIARLREYGMSVTFLPERFDVDEPQDLGRLYRYVRANRETMSHVHAYFGSQENRAISVIVPARNEAKRLKSTLAKLRGIPGISQVVVVDGESTDGSWEIANGATDVDAIRCAPGRGRQMNAGALAAWGGALVFLHADAHLPRDASEQIWRCLGEANTEAGAFLLKTEYDTSARRRPWVAPFLRLADARSRYTRFPYGDQAPFVRAKAFRKYGGFCDMPIFEDLEFAQRLARSGPWGRAPGPVRVSGRRFQERPLYYLGLMNSFPLLYRLGVSPRALAAFYRQTR